MNDWLSEIEESNRRAQEVRKRHVTLSSKELPRERMARVLREQSAFIKLLTKNYGLEYALGFDNLSDDAKELIRKEICDFCYDETDKLYSYPVPSTLETADLCKKCWEETMGMTVEEFEERASDQ